MYQLGPQKPLNYRSRLEQIRSMYQKPIAQTSTALLLTLATITFFGIAAIRPTLSTVSKLIGELEEKRELDDQITRKLSALAQAQDTFLTYQDTFTVLDEAIPPQQQLDQLILLVGYLADQHQTPLTFLRLDGLALVGSLPATSKKSTSTHAYPSIQIQFSAEGTFSQLKSFLDDLNRLSRFITVETLSFSRPDTPDDNTNPELLSVNARISGYYSPGESVDLTDSSNTNNPPGLSP